MDNFKAFKDSMKMWLDSLKENNDLTAMIFKEDVEYLYSKLTEEEKKLLVFEASATLKESNK